MLTQDLFTVALNIKSPWYITNIEFSEENKKLDIFIDFKKGATFTYEKESNLKAYDTKEKTWRHLNFFEHECYLHARVPRVRLKNEKVKLIQVPWEGLSSGFTLLFEALLMQLTSAMPVQKVAKIVNESDDKLWAMLHRYVEGAREHEDFSAVDKIGVDETARARRHKYVSLFVDLDIRKTIFATEGKDSKVIKEFADDFAIHNGTAEDIKHISMDMSKSFIKGAKEHLPNAKITFDKFHIMKIINEAVDAVRREEAPTTNILKEARYTLLKNEENLTKKQSQKLNELKMSKENLKTMRAYNMRLSFQQIYSNAGDTEEFAMLLRKWYFWATHSQLEPMKKVAGTIKRHWDGIVAFQESKINNGVLEGINSVVQAAKSKARGYKTNRNFIAIIYLLTGGLDFNKVNHAYVEA